MAQGVRRDVIFSQDVRVASLNGNVIEVRERAWGRSEGKSEKGISKYVGWEEA